MRIVLTNLGKKEIINTYNEYNIDNKITNKPPRRNNNFKEHFHSQGKISSKELDKIINFNSCMNKRTTKIFKNPEYNNQINYNQKLRKTIYKNIQEKNDSPIKLISLNDSVFSFPIEAKDFYHNIKSENFKSQKLISEDKKTKKNRVRTISINNKILPKIESKHKVISLKNILSTKNKEILEEKFLKKKINTDDRANLVKYLRLNKDIMPSFVKKISQANNDKLTKFDKICERYFSIENKRNYLKDNISKKIIKNFILEKNSSKKELMEINNDLKGIENIYKGMKTKIENLIIKKKAYLKEIKENK